MSRLILAHRPSSAPASQRGAATLLVVMILFFVISMVAAYTNRSLLFEQKTASNQYRSTRALEAADAGAEWALAMLNTGRITANCATSTSTADTDFRQRYLNTDATTGIITPRKRADGVTDLHPTCVYDGTNWVCDCPTDADPAVAAPAGTDIFPAFRVRFRTVTPAQPGVINIDVNGCTALVDSCLAFPSSALPGEGRAAVHIVAALRAALPSAPAAALTVRGAPTINNPLRVVNAEAAGSGFTIHAGQAVVDTGAILQSKPGSPASLSTYQDAVLGALNTDRFFSNVFASWREPYRVQPGAIQIDCTSGCSAATLRTKVSLNPGRVFWIVGDLDIDSAGDIGSAAQPVLINVTGNLTFSTPANVYGLVYSHAANWTLTGGGFIFGAAMGEGDFDGTGTQIIYTSDVLLRLRTITGSFVRVPGSWKDYET